MRLTDYSDHTLPAVVLAAALTAAACSTDQPGVQGQTAGVSELAEPVVQNGSAAAPAPDGMVLVPGGVTRIGSESGEAVEQPVVAIPVKRFYMDRHPVTVAEFREFVEATGYASEAERFGNAGVLDFETGEWALVDGASWHHPLGPDAEAAKDDHPVTQVSWNDARAYADWVGKRLPTEAEWEHAARGASDDRSPYPFGDSLISGGRHLANTWQGDFPKRPSPEDGYMFTSPVGTFGYTELGLADMAGNVWEWCEDGFAPYGSNPRASASGERVLRGGSFLCTKKVCHGYRVSARSHASPETSLFSVGFRLVSGVAG